MLQAFNQNVCYFLSCANTLFNVVNFFTLQLEDWCCGLFSLTKRIFFHWSTIFHSDTLSFLQYLQIITTSFFVHPLATLQIMLSNLLFLALFGCWFVILFHRMQLCYLVSCFCILATHISLFLCARILV